MEVEPRRARVKGTIPTLEIGRYKPFYEIYNKIKTKIVVREDTVFGRKYIDNVCRFKAIYLRAGDVKFKVRVRDVVLLKNGYHIMLGNISRSKEADEHSRRVRGGSVWTRRR